MDKTQKTIIPASQRKSLLTVLAHSCDSYFHISKYHDYRLLLGFSVLLISKHKARRFRSLLLSPQIDILFSTFPNIYIVIISGIKKSLCMIGILYTLFIVELGSSFNYFFFSAHFVSVRCNTCFFFFSFSLVRISVFSSKFIPTHPQVCKSLLNNTRI